MLKEFHIRNLQQKNKIFEKMNDLTKTLEESKLVAEAAVETFKVDRDLLKFVVGSKGSNIQAARYSTVVVWLICNEILEK